MAQRRLQIPNGMQDTLPGECARKRQLEEQLRRLFTLEGYQEIETPVLEYYEALDDRTWGYRPEDLWKTFDSTGRILAVRPDSTIPAARMAAGRLAEAPLPLFFYTELRRRMDSLRSKGLTSYHFSGKERCSFALGDRRRACPTQRQALAELNAFLQSSADK